MVPAHSGPITGGLWAITGGFSAPLTFPWAWRLGILLGVLGQPRETPHLHLNTFSEFLNEEQHKVKDSFVLQRVRRKSWGRNELHHVFSTFNIAKCWLLSLIMLNDVSVLKM